MNERILFENQHAPCFWLDIEVIPLAFLAEYPRRAEPGTQVRQRGGLETAPRTRVGSLFRMCLSFGRAPESTRGEVDEAWEVRGEDGGVARAERGCGAEGALFGVEQQERRQEHRPREKKRIGWWRLHIDDPALLPVINSSHLLVARDSLGPNLVVAQQKLRQDLRQLMREFFWDHSVHRGTKQNPILSDREEALF
ncbi:hypothetical protein C0995_014047 [Termitomyces sp. Mi166|nr:hypothetical protein C0995_014047 [Termitomyces sp. Mi166\